MKLVSTDQSIAVFVRVGRFVMLAIGLATAGVACARAQFVDITKDTPIVCTVTRRECLAENQTAGCMTFAATAETIVGTTCYNATADGSMDNRCKTAFCTRPEANGWATYDYAAPPACSVTSAAADLTLLPKAGTCTPTPSGVGLSRVDFVPRSRVCKPFSTSNPACQSLDIDPPPPPATQIACVDLSTTGAWKMAGIAPSSDRRDPIMQILRVRPGDTTGCPGPSAGMRTSALTTGQHATASAAGATTPITFTRGFASIGQSCDGESCVDTSLDSFRADVANMTVAGSQITNAAITLAQPAPLTLIPDPDGGGSGVAAHGLKFLVQGKVDGVNWIIRAENDRSWSVNTAGGGFRLTGTLTFLATDATGKLLPVTVSADIPGTPATPQQNQCASFTSLQRLFGFENVQDWSSSQATLSLVTSPVTQGCGALGIQGQGYLPIKGGAFSTAGLPVSAALSTDLFIPNNQPNQFYLGALQMYLSCPSGNVFNQYIGQVELTGKPQNTYSTLRFPLPAPVRTTLTSNLNDCFFSFALNVNQTNRTWILDNLRFTP